MSVVHGPGVGAVLTPISERGIGGLDLRERLPFVDQILNSVADDRDRVAVLQQVELVVHEPVPGHQERAVRLPLQRHVEDAQIHQAVQCIELALDGAAALDVDDTANGSCR